MTMRFTPPEAPESASPPRGAAPVGAMHELPPIELAAVVCLRAWCAGGDDRAMVGRDFRLVLGDEAGAEAVADFDALMTVMLEGARRPIMCHALDCGCFGGDESAFANMIAAAAGRDREDALLFAGTLLTGPAAWVAVSLAERLGQAFLRLARRPARGTLASGPAGRTSYMH